MQRQMNGALSSSLQKADMAVASITVTSIREEVIKFTKPYMELQNSYVKRRSNVMQLDVLQFLSPFSAHVWMITVLAGIAGSIVIYYVELYSPSGWRNVVDEENGANGGIFSVANSIWFTVSSWLLQGAENTPRSLSGKYINVVAFFGFTLRCKLGFRLDTDFQSLQQQQQRYH